MTSILDDEPLSVLVSRVLVPLVWELDGQADGALAVWADLLRVLPVEGAATGDLLALAHVSPRSMKVLVTAATRAGLVTIAKTSTGGEFMRPTRAGRTQCGAWESRVADIEQRWQVQYETPPLATALRDIVGPIAIDLPWLLLPYGPADGSAAIGPPVQRATTPDDMPLFALLSQFLAALALAYEAQHGWMLSMMATTFAGFPDDGVPIADVAAFAGVKGNGKTLHERHGIVTVNVDPDQPKRKIVRLTDKGRRFRDPHRPTIEAVERDWAAQDGPESLVALRRALGLVAGRLPTAHIRHLCMAYRPGPRYVESSPRA